MTFGTVDFTGSVSCGTLASKEKRKRSSQDQATSDNSNTDFFIPSLEKNRPSVDTSSASTYRSSSYNNCHGSGSSGSDQHSNNNSNNTSNGSGNEEFHRLLNTRDSQLKKEMDRRERTHQREIGMLKEEIALLRKQNSHSHSNSKGLAIAENIGSDDDTMSSEFLNDTNQHSKHTVRSINSKFSDERSLPSLEDKFKHLERQISNIERGTVNADDDHHDEEGIDLPLLPEDTFSYLAFSKWNSTSMLTAICVLAIQTMTLFVLALDFSSTNYPGNYFGVPVSVNTRTATIQVIALFIIVFSQGDLHDSLNLLFMGYDKEELENNLHTTITYPRWLISLSTRLFVTSFGLAITFVMIVRESDVTQLLLDFTSIEFVTNIDNIFFWLTAWGYLGLSAQRDATVIVRAKAPVLVQEEDFGQDPVSLKRISNNRRRRRSIRLHVKKKSKMKNSNPHAAIEGLEVDKNSERDNKDYSIHSLNTLQSIREDLKFGEDQRSNCYSRFPRFLFLAAIYFTLLTGWAFNYYWQRTGTFVCGTIFVQFNDIYHPGLATFSGLFTSKCGDDGYCKRSAYVESGHGSYSDTARFFFCEDIQAWVFAFDEGHQFNCENWISRSPEQDIMSVDSYNILASVQGNDPWTIRVGDRRQLPIPEFTLECYDCKYDESFCGGEGRGKCVDNRCVCEDGWYGYRCDYFMPCDELEVNPLHAQGLRPWAGKYRPLMAPLTGEDRNNNVTDPSKILKMYNRPTYIGGGNTVPVEVIFYNGRRWVNIVLDSSVSIEEMKYTLLDTHAYWTNYTAAFITGPVDVNTPEDFADPSRLDWFDTNPQNIDIGRVQGPNLQNSLIDLRLLCASCNNQTNPCFYGGNCTADAVCECAQGEKGGKLCQIPPTENGFCDITFNTPQYNFDGGDCCEGTCDSTVEHQCGVVEESTELGTTLAYVGFPSCTDPDAVKQISGSHTLYQIVERGKVICGTYISTFLLSFFEAQCQAIAAAVLGNKDAFEIAYWGSDTGINRFIAMSEGKYDIVFGSDFLANRDVFEKKSKLPYSFAPMPYYFAGLTFAGIPKFLDCADNHDYSSPGCQGVKICIAQFSSWYDVVASIFPPESIVGTGGMKSSVPALQQGLCNVFGATRYEVLEENVVSLGYDINLGYAVGDRMHSKSFETWMTRSDDRQWTKITSWIFEALVQAEQSRITQASAVLMKSTTVFNDPRNSFDDLFRNAVGANGNFGEIWDKTMPFSRPSMNHVCNGTSGLIMSQGFGSYGDVGDRPSEGGQIERIIQRGALQCAIDPATGFATFNEQTNRWTGLEVDICRAIAAAIFNGQPKVDFVTTNTTDVFTGVKSGRIDLATGKSRTLEREIKHESSGGFAFDFSPPYFYDGMIFAGFEPYGRCAANLLFDGACTDTLICVSEISTWHEALVALGVPDKNILLTKSTYEGLEKHLAMECNALVSESHKLNQTLIVMDNYFVGTERHTEEPLSLMHRSDDPQFSDLIRWIIYGLIYAEEKGITKERSIDMPTTNLFGSELTGIWQNSVRESGGYGEIFTRNLDGIVARGGLNLLNRLDGPQLCAAPGTAPFL